MILVRQLASLFDIPPRLSGRTRAAVARHAWIVALVVSILGVISIVGGIVIVFVLRNAIANYTAAMSGTQLASTIVVSVVSYGLFLTSIILTALAVRPLRHLETAGWNRAYLASLLYFANTVVLPLVVFLALLMIPNLRPLSPGRSWQSLQISLDGLAPIVVLFLLFKVRDRFTASRTSSRPRHM